MKNTFYKRDVLSVETFSRPEIDYVLATTEKMKTLVETKGGTDILKGKIMTALFYEPSTRTFSSFVAAMQRLGGGFIPLQGVQFSSVSKGEILTDTVRTLASYTDVIVIRHPEVGSARTAAEFAEIPVVNAGDGIGEHPTQALQDLFTIKRNFGAIEGLHIVMIGDLAHYRPVNSLARALVHFNKVKISFVSPDEVKIQDELRDYLKQHKANFQEHKDLDAVLGEADVLYVSRVKKEYMSDALYKRIRGSYIIDKSTLKHMKQKSIVMHPFPRVDEIDVEVDFDTRAVYIREQMKNGMYTRMALLALILKKELGVL